MPLTSELRDAIASEIKTFGSSLNLSDDQRQKLNGLMTDATQKLQDYKEKNPHASKEDLLKKVADNRASIRQRLASILSPDQLAKWDSEMSRAKAFLGQKLAA